MNAEQATEAALTAAVGLIEKHEASGYSPFNFRTWVENEILQVYLRAGYKYILGVQTLSLELASITVVENHRCRGICSRLLAGLETVAKMHDRSFFVEQVLSPNSSRLAFALRNRGYEEIRRLDASDFYLDLE